MFKVYSHENNNLNTFRIVSKECKKKKQKSIRTINSRSNLPIRENFYKIDVNDCKQTINERIDDKQNSEWQTEQDNKLQQIKKDR